jgi:hypothetical protein
MPRGDARAALTIGNFLDPNMDMVGLMEARAFVKTRHLSVDS